MENKIEIIKDKIKLFQSDIKYYERKLVETEMELEHWSELYIKEQAKLNGTEKI